MVKYELMIWITVVIRRNPTVKIEYFPDKYFLGMNLDLWSQGTK